jgi:hypothetical protein
MTQIVFTDEEISALALQPTPPRSISNKNLPSKSKPVYVDVKDTNIILEFEDGKNKTYDAKTGKEEK